MKAKKKISFPSSMVILFMLIVLVTIFTYIIPAGNFATVINDAGVSSVDANSFTRAEQTPVGIFKMFTMIPKGFINAAQLICLIIMGDFWVFSVVGSGAVSAGIGKLLKSKARDSKLFIPICFLIFALAGSTYGEMETVYALVPIFIAISIAMGYDAVVGICMSYVGVAVGFASATTNPFTIGVAQSIAELPIFSGLLLRWVIFVVFCTVSIIFIMKYADKVKKDPTKSVVYGDDFSSFKLEGTEENIPFTGTHKLLLAGMVVTIVVIVNGTLNLGWWLDEMSATFFISGVISQIIAKKTPNEMAKSMGQAISDMSVAIAVLGFSRAILLVLQEGNIIDSIIYGLYQPMKNASAGVVGFLMLVVQNIINFFIPSGSGQASTIMPIMTPLADLAGIKRQAAVLAFQFGDGYSNILYPTSGIAIVCGIAKVDLGKWYKFFLPLFGIMFVLETLFMIYAVVSGYGPF